MASAVAAILKPDGGFRVVVTQWWRMRAHVQKGERLFVVPGLKVKEPVPWNGQADVIEAARKYMMSKIAPVNHCGECKACCVTLFIDQPDIQKPSHTPCRNLCADGCSLYWKRPKVCAGFKCGWLQSQDTAEPMDAELRPDKSLVILTGPEKDDPENAIRIHSATRTDSTETCQMSPAMKDWLDVQERKGKQPRIVTHYIGENAT